MPTPQDWKQLWENCTWTRATLNGVTGVLVTARNGNSIFLPAAGALFGGTEYFIDPVTGGAYWSSSLATDYDAYNFAFYFYDDPWNADDQDYEWGTSRWAGLSVRPVFAQ